MFRKTRQNAQLDLFSSPEMQLCKRAAKKYSDPLAWHNKFFEMITSRIDEEIFRPLFKEDGKKEGRPNASIRIIVAMSVLKEGFGCSDEELFEKCDYDMLTRKALGLLNMTDAAPSLDTYYLFRRRLVEYESATGTDLMQQCFAQVTKEQVKSLNISGKSVRMDSKLIGSNIANHSRYELIQRTLVKFLRVWDLALLGQQARQRAEEYLKENATGTVYRADKDTLNNRLQEIGEFIHAILGRYTSTMEGYPLLERLFNDQYTVVDDKVILRDRKEISADSLQSPDDPDATFRTKNGKNTKGYSANTTETIPEKDKDGKTVKPSIITDVRVEPANTADTDFLVSGVEASEAVTGQKADEVYADGAYQSPDNRAWATQRGTELKTGKMQGGSRFILTRKDGTDEVTVTDTVTGEVIQATHHRTRKGSDVWFIPHPDKEGKKRYFSEKAVANSMLRQQLLKIPPEELARRNNVEAAMFQYSFHTRLGKTRYRGLLKHRMQAYGRCMWMNLRRIVMVLFALIFGAYEAFQNAFGSILGSTDRDFGFFTREPALATGPVICTY